MRYLRRMSLRGVLVAVLFLITCTRCDNSKDKSANKEFAGRPNVVLIVADDLGYGDLGVYGQEKFNTPNIDALARDGMLFREHYAGSTVCAPSRSSLMTGQHTGHTPIRGNKEWRPEGQYPLEGSAVTLAEIFKKEGYATGAFGKWGLGYPGSEGDPNNQGFDEFFGHNCQRIGHHYYPFHLWHNQDKVILTENAEGENGVYAPEIIHTYALDFIERHKEEPFFLFYPTIIPHAELIAPESYMEMFRGSFDPEKPFRGVDKGEEGFRDGRYGSQEYPRAAFAAMITYLDMQVGEIVDLLKKEGLYNNTIIVFTSDNGPHVEGGADPDYFDSNGMLRGYKRDLYEGGIRVPMIVSWKDKVAAGSESDHVSAFWDLMPTFSEILDTESPLNTDGISMLPTLLSQEGQEKHEYLYWEFHEGGGKQAVRKGNWKLVRLDVFNAAKSRTELFDLSTDPGEKNNIAAKHPELVSELLLIADTARTESELFPFHSRSN